MELGVWKFIGGQGDPVKDRGESRIGQRDPWTVVQIWK